MLFLLSGTYKQANSQEVSPLCPQGTGSEKVKKSRVNFFLYLHI